MRLKRIKKLKISKISSDFLSNSKVSYILGIIPLFSPMAYIKNAYVLRKGCLHFNVLSHITNMRIL